MVTGLYAMPCPMLQVYMSQTLTNVVEVAVVVVS